MEKHVPPEANNSRWSRHCGHQHASRFAKSKRMVRRQESNTSTQPQTSNSHWQDWSRWQDWTYSCSGRRGPPRRRKAEPSCPPIPIAEIRSAAGSFNAVTSVGGFHPRHFWLLSDEALRAPCKLLHVAEASGDMPCVQARLSWPHSAKPTGEGRGGVQAHRALPQSVPYVWAKAPRHFVQAVAVLRARISLMVSLLTRFAQQRWAHLRAAVGISKCLDRYRQCCTFCTAEGGKFTTPLLSSPMTAARFSLLLVSPVELRSRFRSPVALQAQLNRLWRMGVRDSSFKPEAEIVATKGFVDEPIKALLRGKALTALHKACLCWFVVGGLWTCAAFEAAGSDINPSCPLCVVSSCQQSRDRRSKAQDRGGCWWAGYGVLAGYGGQA